MSSSRTTHRLSTLALVTLLLAFALRICHLPDQSLWYDEALSVYYAAQPMDKMLAGISGSDHPPLHSLSLHVWMGVAGQSELAVRYLSLWWGVLGVALLYRLGKQFFDKTIALLATALLTVSPFHVLYSQEARMYSLALALSLGVVLSLQAIIASRRASLWPWFGYVLTGALALYAHFYTSFVLIFANVAFAEWWLVRAVREGWRTMRGLLVRWAAAQVIVLSLFLPWGHFVAEQYTTNATYWHGALGLGQIIRDTALAFAAGDRGRVPLAQAAALALAAAALWGLQATARNSSGPGKQGISRRERALWLLLWLAVPVTALFAISHDRPKFAPRYLLSAQPAMLLLAAVGSVHLARVVREKRRSSPAQRVGRWLAAAGLLLGGTLIAGASIGSLHRQYFDEALARPDFRAVSHYVEQHSQVEDAVVLIGGHSYPVFAYYSEGDLPVYPMPPRLLLSTRQPLDHRALAQLAEIVADRERLWLVLWQHRLADPTEVVLSALLRACPRLGVDQKFHGVALLLFSVRDCDLTAQSSPTHPLRVEFGGQMRLLGYDLEPIAVAPGGKLDLTLYWEAMGQAATDYTTFVQLLGPDGQIYAQHDRLTGDDAYPTSRWQPGAVIMNSHTPAVSPGTPLGTYQLIVGLYVAEGDLPRLPITYPVGMANDAALIAHIKVKE
jgi:4-amino-4-deoxy-L-arabinose transferase-like glycosyltransferase